MRPGNGLRIAIGAAALVSLGAILMGGYLLKSMESRAELIPVGHAAPDFTAISSSGGVIHLSDVLRTKRVVLVFYPGDYTPVCTAQLCAFRDNWEALSAEKTVIYGINPAGKEKHSGFATKNRLPFPLLVDPKGEISSVFGCRAIFGLIKRTVYIVDQQGKIAWVKRGNPLQSEILRQLRAMGSNTTSEAKD